MCDQAVTVGASADFIVAKIVGGSRSKLNEKEGRSRRGKRQGKRKGRG